MDKNLKPKIEEIIGKIKAAKVLDEQGWTSEVSKITTTQGNFILKSSFQQKYRVWLQQEADVLRENEELPLPRFHGYIEQENASHLLMSFEEGVSLRTALKETDIQEQRKELTRSFGLFLQKLHEREINVEPGYNWLDIQLKRAQHYVDLGQAEGNQELLDRLKEHKPMPVPQTMVHGDCAADNVMVQNGEVSLFIDVAAMTVGDPRYDEALAIRRFIDEPELVEAFYEGYTRYRLSPEEYSYFEGGLYEFF